MPLYLQIMAVALLVIVLFSMKKYSHLKAKNTYRTTIYNAVTQPIFKVHVKPDTNPAWIKSDEAQVIIEEFKSAGFKSGKSYVVYEFGRLLIHSMFNGNFAAMVLNHPEEGLWAEVCFQCEDGKFMLVTNSSFGIEHNSHLDNIIIYVKDCTPAGLYNLIKQDAVGKFGVELSDENFKPVIEEYHRRELCLKNNRGGITIQEFKNNIKSINSDIKITKDDLRKIFLEMKVDELHRWHEACIEQYRFDTQRISNKFDYLLYELFIVPKRTISQAYIEYLADYEIIDKQKKDELIKAMRKKTDIQKIFDVINKAFAEDLQASFVGEVDFPLKARIYKRSDKVII